MILSSEVRFNRCCGSVATTQIVTIILVELKGLFIFGVFWMLSSHCSLLSISLAFFSLLLVHATVRLLFYLHQLFTLLMSCFSSFLYIWIVCLLIHTGVLILPRYFGSFFLFSWLAYFTVSTALPFFCSFTLLYFYPPPSRFATLYEFMPTYICIYSEFFVHMQ